jgi:hypothetical protein
MAARNKDFAWASGKFQVEAYKEEIEANLRTPGLRGYQLLDLHDYLGQGTALVGILDTFWESKGYATAKEFRRYNGQTVPLARLLKRTYATNENLSVDVEISHFGAAPLADAQAYWQLVDATGRVAAGGDLTRQTIGIGKNIALGKIQLPLAALPAPQAYRLVIGLRGTTVQNDWNIWLYPTAAAPEPADVLVTHSWPAAEARLAQGGKVLYLPLAADLDWSGPPLDTVPVFWNRLMNPQWGRMLGVWVDSKHPALAQFPTDRFNDWQWTELVKGTRTINLDRLPPALQPVVQPIDDWNRNYKLGLLVEAKVGNGKLMAASMDLESDLANRLVARQLRASLLAYMAGDGFKPQTAVSAAEFRNALFDTLTMKKLGANAGDAAAAIDGDPNTFATAKSISISFPRQVAFSGLIVMPRQNHRDHEGDVRDYLLEASDDGINWRELKRGALVSTYDQQRIDLGQTVSARQLRFTALSGFGADKSAAIAELALIYQGPPLPENSGPLDYKRVKSESNDIDENITPEPRQKRQ